MNQSLTTNILLGITGAIAAYKTPELVRRLRDSGANVQVVLTKNAEQFVAPLALQAVSGHLVRQNMWDAGAENAMGHIELARFADKILIAPASADFIARLAHGFADDLLTTLCLATDAPIYLAPSMNRLMWENAATQANLALLKNRGMHIIAPTSGEQACGEYGMGRMPEVEDLVAEIFTRTWHKKILITAGPTIEAIDPVRFISNHSSGKMGYALAMAAKNLGAEVTLISGPVQLAPIAQVKTIAVNTALEMQQAVLAHIKNQDIFISTAAVADYRPVEAMDQKIKKDASDLTLQLVRNPDILQSVAQLPNPPFLVGFAAETHDILKNAQRKLTEKNVDMICVNDVSQADIGFHSDENVVTVLTQTTQTELPRATKKILAEQIMQTIMESMHEKNSIKST